MIKNLTHLPRFASLRSIGLLQDRCKSVLGGERPVFLYNGADLVWPKTKVANVVLMGGPFRQLYYPEAWIPALPFRLWVLSQANKNLMTTLLGFSEREVSVLPRSLLLPHFKRPHSSHQPFSKDVHLVVSSRLVPEKNFALSFAVANRIQKLAPVNVRFSVCGPRLDAAIARRELARYKWKIPPRVLGSSGDLGPDWIRHIDGHPILLSLSTSYQEDFAVSATQSAAAGWPLILSQWGAHAEIRSESLQSISPALIQSAKTSAGFANAVESIARQCLETNFVTTAARRDERLNPPAVLTYEKIKAKMSKLTPSAVKTLDVVFSDQPKRKTSSTQLINKIDKVMSGDQQMPKLKKVKKTVRPKAPAKSAKVTAKILKLVPSLVLVERADKSVMVMNTRNTSKYFQIDGLAAQIIQKIDGEKSLTQILKTIKLPVGFSPEMIDELANGFVRDLSKLGLIAKA